MRAGHVKGGPTVTDEDARYRRFILDQLPPAERERIEEALLTDTATLAVLEAVETDLVDDYARGALADDASRRFEGLVRASPRLRERVAFARSLAAVGDAAARFGPPLRQETAPRLAPWRRWGLAAAAALVATLTGTFWLAGPASHRSATDDRPAVARREVTVELGMAMRGQEVLPRVALDDGVDTLVLGLDLGGEDRYRALQVSVRSGAGELVWRRRALEVEGLPERPHLVARIPASGLGQGRHLVEVSAAEGGEAVPIAYYDLQVER